MARLSRRRLLWIGGFGLAALAMRSGWNNIQPKRRRVEDLEPDRLDRFELPPRVVVVGGGLAGMSAALELAERGAAVTLIEAAPHLGGKLGGWSIEVGGEPYATEHGFHAFFDQYYNLDDVIQRLGVSENFSPATSYPMLFGEGEPESFEPGSSGFPLNLGTFFFESNNLELRSMVNAGPEMQALLTYDHELTFASYDHLSFADYCEAGVDPELYAFFFGPFARTTLNDPAKVSAAYVIQFFHFYYLGNPEGLGFRQNRDDSMTALIRPWRARLESLGVEVITGVEARALSLEDGRVTAVELGRELPAGPLVRGFDPSRVSAAAPVEIGRDARDVPLYAVRSGDEVLALRGRCTHQGCSIAPAAEGFVCPCHGGRFDRQGRPTAGPPQRPLERLRITGDQVFAAPAARRTLPADAVVLATDVRGTRAIIGASQVPGSLASGVDSLREAAPFIVVRLWFDRQFSTEGPGFWTTGQFELLDSIAILERLQRASQAWAERHGGSIIELHAYAISPEDDRGPQGNRDVLLAEFLECMPEYRGAGIVHEEVMQQSNFSGFPVASHALRPRHTTAVPNLVLAGDWVCLELPVALMEAAVTSGRLAANEILAAHGVRRASYDTVPLRGVLA